MRVVCGCLWRVVAVHFVFVLFWCVLVVDLTPPSGSLLLCRVLLPWAGGRRLYFLGQIVCHTVKSVAWKLEASPPPPPPSPPLPSPPNLSERLAHPPCCGEALNNVFWLVKKCGAGKGVVGVTLATLRVFTNVTAVFFPTHGKGWNSGGGGVLC